MNETDIKGKSSTHQGGKGEPFHDWYPYLEGFSSDFVKGLQENYFKKDSIILEPFAGVGTTPLYLARNNIDCYYCEINPLLRHVIKTKLDTLKLSTKKKFMLLTNLESHIINIKNINQTPECDVLKENYDILFKNSKFFNPENYSKILKLKKYLRDVEDGITKDILDLSVYSSLLKSSFLKRAGDVRYRTKKDLLRNPVKNVIDCVIDKINLISKDIENTDTHKFRSILLADNSKNLKHNDTINADGIITSPPYLNGTNYIRNTKLELFFMEYINSTTSLRYFRDRVITSGINDVNKDTDNTILPEIKETYNRIYANAYDCRIPKMIANYFNDMNAFFEGAKKQLRKNAIICLDIGDSIYANEKVETDKLLIEIAKRSKIKVIDTILLRQRYSKNKEKLSQKLLVFRT